MSQSQQSTGDAIYDWTLEGEEARRQLSWVTDVDFPAKRRFAVAKRLFDVLVSGGLLVALSPVIGGTALVVRMNLGKPVLFRQIRPGRHAREFEILKFRTMRDIRDEEGKLLPDELRTSALGTLLRTTSLDELPELWSVLKGDMSLVGPRPLLPSYVPYFRDTELARFRARPGITGLAQVNGRNRVAWDQRLALDVAYVETADFLTDLRILAKTVWLVLTREGVSAAPRLLLQDLDDERRDGKTS